ncbi:MAG TPA: Flp family type IVb pilin [Sphingomonadales bacterium]|nr:Flp family type IVb pilin [Sphingomonadales bacterium]
MFKFLRKLRKDESGATAIEYGLIAALISIAAILAMTAVGTSLSGIFNTVSNELSAAAAS